MKTMASFVLLACACRFALAADEPPPPAASGGAAFPKPYTEPCVERENVFEFAGKPKVRKVGEDKYEITFAVKGGCDATVAIVDDQGRTVRHVASGVLGSNAPLPFQKDSLSSTDGFAFWHRIARPAAYRRIGLRRIDDSVGRRGAGDDLRGRQGWGLQALDSYTARPRLWICAERSVYGKPGSNIVIYEDTGGGPFLANKAGIFGSRERFTMWSSAGVYMHSVAVLDANGNLLLHIGRYRQRQQD